jgi:NAD(P)-dependent dehydrogenase (short-subunit alcohol dehydrogenase family)
MRPVKIQSSIVLITGVTRGLGRAMADEFIRLGHTVLGCARTGRQIDELSRLYPQHDFQTVDVASDLAVKTWAARLLKRYGAPDFVLNNAAVFTPQAPLWMVKEQDFSIEVDINIKGVVNVIRYIALPMIERKRGVVVNFSSRWGTHTEKEMATYCATKWAVVALTRVLAEDLRPHGVAAIALNPGIVNTSMLQKYLRSSLSPDRSCYLTADKWARIAVPFILTLNMKDTGKLRTVPQLPSVSGHRAHAMAESPHEGGG